MVNNQLNEITIPSNGGKEVTYSILPYSTDVLKSMKEYDVSDFYVAGQLAGFGECFEKYKNEQSYFQSIDKHKGVALLFHFTEDSIELINILDVDNILVNDGLMSYKLK